MIISAFFMKQVIIYGLLKIRILLFILTFFHIKEAMTNFQIIDIFKYIVKKNLQDIPSHIAHVTTDNIIKPVL